jgi:NADPH:quinone reductase-like Zn-dependent oxidoreductase
MYIRLCAKEGIETINLVRNDDHITNLKEEYGAKHVLNTNSGSFFNDLEGLIKEFNPTILISYLGGDLPGKIFVKMPESSEMVVLGFMTQMPLTLDNTDILFNLKTVTGVTLFKWLQKKTLEERKQWI